MYGPSVFRDISEIKISVCYLEEDTTWFESISSDITSFSDNCSWFVGEVQSPNHRPSSSVEDSPKRLCNHEQICERGAQGLIFCSKNMEEQIIVENGIESDNRKQAILPPPSLSSSQRRQQSFIEFICFPCLIRGTRYL